MSDNLTGIFTDEQKRTLILQYLYSFGVGVQVPIEDIAAFLKACQVAVVEGESVRMAADGLVHVQWDKENGFAFRISEAGIKSVQANGETSE